MSLYNLDVGVYLQFIIVAGSLGVDRHPVIRGLVGLLRKDGARQVAVISSQHGNPCMDDSFIADNDVMAREMVGGCVNCSLKTDLLSCVRDILRQGRPDFLIFEPSGTTDPGTIKDALIDAKEINVEKVTTLLVLDSEDFERTWSIFQRPLRNHLREADLVLALGWESISENQKESLM